MENRERWREKNAHLSSCSWAEALGMGSGCQCFGQGPVATVVQLCSCNHSTADMASENSPSFTSLYGENGIGDCTLLQNTEAVRSDLFTGQAFCSMKAGI